MVLYLSGVAGPEARALMAEGRIGQMRQPNGNALYADVWAADNGYFSGRRMTLGRWLRWLEQQPTTALWALVPDEPLNHAVTLAKWGTWASVVRDVGFRPCFAAQDGCEKIPFNAEGLFLGGTTEWKTGPEAERLVKMAVRRGIPAHMGRVNSFQRLQLAADWGCDTVDGTFLAKAPSQNVPRLLEWLEKLR